jgi:hypothetical protein
MMLRESWKRKRQYEEGVGVRKKQYIKWDRERARQCIADDYLGAVPKFNTDEFKCMFRVSRNNCERIRIFVCGFDPFFVTVMMQPEGDLFS